MKAEEIKMGMNVTYWNVINHVGQKYDPTYSYIASEPWDCCGEILVKIVGKAGGVSIKHLEPTIYSPPFKYIVSSETRGDSELLDSIEEAEQYVTDWIPYGEQKCRTSCYCILEVKEDQSAEGYVEVREVR